MPAYAVELLEATRRRWPARACSILGVAYRGDVKETAFSGAFAAARRARGARRRAVVAADPLYDDDELRALGFEPWDGAAVDAAPSCRPTTPPTARSGREDLPGARAVVDGRGLLDPARASPPPASRCGASATAQRQREASAATTRSPARPSP